MIILNQSPANSRCFTMLRGASWCVTSGSQAEAPELAPDVPEAPLEEAQHAEALTEAKEAQPWSLQS